MTKIITRGVLASFIIALVFSFNIFTPRVEAQTMTLCQTIEALIAAGVIPPENAYAARMAGGCVIPANAVAVNTLGSSLYLGYDNENNESRLEASFDNIKVTADQDSDLNVYKNSSHIAFVNQTNDQQIMYAPSTLLLGTPLESHTDVYGRQYWTVPAGKSANFTVKSTANPKIMFAGSYVAVITSIMVSDSVNAVDSYSLAIQPNPSNQTNAVVIVGETSPYITNAYSEYTNNGLNVTVKGVRLQNSSPANLASDYWGLISAADGTGLAFLTKVSTTTEEILLQVADPKTGASNVVSVSVPVKPVVTAPKVSLTYKKALDAGSFIAGPALVPAGTEILLNWTSDNSTSCAAIASPAVSTWSGTKSADGYGSIGKVNVSGTYKLTCTGAGGTTSSTIDILVGGGSAPVITLGSTVSGTKLACDATNVKLAWTAVTGATSYNLRADDTANSWNGSCTSPSAGDRCKNGLTGTSDTALYPVTAGHSYNYWVDTSSGTSRKMTFSVAKCDGTTSTPGPASNLNISLAGNYIDVEELGDDSSRANGTFKFRATAVGQDFLVSNTIERNAINVIKNGEVVGKVTSIQLNSTAKSDGASFLVEKGTTQNFTLSYIMDPLKGSGSYQAKLLFIPLVKGGSVNVDSPSYQFVSDTVMLNGVSVPVVVPSTPTSTTPVGPTSTDITIGQTSSGKVLECTVTKTKLSWAAQSGATYYNIRVDDTNNGWSGQWDGNPANQATGMNSEDLSWNGYAGVGTISYPVQAGHSYNFWVDSSNGTTQSLKFSVAKCTASTDASLTYASALASEGKATWWQWFADLF